MVGAAYFNRNLDLLALEGRLLQIAVLHGVKAEINLVRLLRQRLTVTGSTLRARTVEEKGAIASALETGSVAVARDGNIRPVICETFPLAKAAEAHRLMESGNHIGKIRPYGLAAYAPEYPFLLFVMVNDPSARAVTFR